MTLDEVQDELDRLGHSRADLARASDVSLPTVYKFFKDPSSVKKYITGRLRNGLVLLKERRRVQQAEVAAR